jgi:hypothetical protein
MSSSHQYFARLQDTPLTRKEIEIESISIRENDPVKDEGRFSARVSFYDESSLEAHEKVSLEDGDIVKDRYSYHYQKSDASLIFRYDNAPHHPEIETHPHHKHVGSDENVVATPPPDLSDVLSEIDEALYSGAD